VATGRAGRSGPQPAEAGRFRVEGREAGGRLDLFLAASVPGLSRKQAKKLIDGRCVAVNGRIEPMASRELRSGEEVAVRFPPAEAARPAESSPAVIYRDESILAVNKPPNLPSGPTKDPRRPHAQALVERAEGERLTLLHRLDRDTTGVLLFAREPEAAERMLASFRGREVEKVYLALVSGRTEPAFEDVCHLREAPGSRVEVVRSGGMRAETSFRTLAFAEGHSLVEARPRTGRMHQIRVQLARLGHPIVGDALYGGAAAIRAGGREVAVPRQMLHALRVGFPHPGRQERREIAAEPPEDFLSVVEALFGRGRRPWE
jgi:23S rRNA pseudouridine1911/1915/1917 synthase